MSIRRRLKTLGTKVRALPIIFAMIGSLFVATSVIMRLIEEKGELLVLPIVNEMLMHLGTGLIVAVCVGLMIDLSFDQTREQARFTEVLHDLFGLRHTIPPDIFHRLVEHFLGIGWVRDKINVTIRLSLPALSEPTQVNYLIAETILRDKLTCIATDSEEHAFPTRQELSPVGATGVPEGRVTRYRLEPEGKSSEDERDPASLEAMCQEVDRHKCFNLEVKAAAGETCELTIEMKRHLLVGEDDVWKSRVPARRIEVEVKYDPNEIAVTGFRYQPSRTPGRTSTTATIHPVVTTKTRKRRNIRTAIFEYGPVLPHEGIIIRPQLRISEEP